MDTEILFLFQDDIDEEYAKRFYVGLSLETYSSEIFRGNKTSSNQITFYLNISIENLSYINIGYDCIYDNCSDFYEYRGV